MNVGTLKSFQNNFHQIGTIYSISLSTIVNPYKKGLSLFLIILFLFFGYIGLTVYKKRIISNYETTAIAAEEAIQKDERIFKEQELLLLNLLITNSSKGIKTTNEEINTELGMDSRSPETQKSQRHKLINSINNAYIAKTERKLILNERLDFDRRSFVFFIAEDELKTLLKYMPVE